MEPSPEAADVTEPEVGSVPARKASSLDSTPSALLVPDEPPARGLEQRQARWLVEREKFEAQRGSQARQEKSEPRPDEED